MGGVGLCAVVRCDRRCSRAKGRLLPRGYIDVVGAGRRRLDQGMILVALQLVLLESPIEVSLSALS